MSSPSRMLSPISQLQSKQSNAQKRPLAADSDTDQQHDSKRAKSQSDVATGELRKLSKDKKKRRKKKRKLSVVDAHMLAETEGRVEPKASGSRSRSRSRSVSLAASNINPPEPLAQKSAEVVNNASREPYQTLSSASKGKGRATPDDAEAQASRQQITDLKDQVSAQTILVTQHENLLSTLQHSLSCQICLDLMHRPFALSPCGHSACHQCLVNWFKAPPPDVPANEVLPVWLRKKTCPHCRAIVRERPVEIWTIKEMVASLVKSGLTQPPVPPPASDAPAPDAAGDIWAGIFRPVPNRNMGVLPGDHPPLLQQQLMGLRDDEDGGIYRCIECHHEIWDGACSECGRVYPGHDPHGQDLDDLDDLDEGAPGPWAHPADEWDDEDDGDYDEDVALAGLDMLRQLFFPAGGMLDEDSEDDSTYGEGSQYDDAGYVRGRSARVEEVVEPLIESEREEEGDEEGYESSFIDDGDDVGVPLPLGAQIRRRAPPVDFDRDHVIDLSEGDEYASGQEDSDNIHFVGFGRRQGVARGRGPVVIDSDEEDDDEEAPYEYSDDDVGLAAEVAARERELYGDDGSVPRRGAAFDDERAYDDEVDEASAGEGYDYGDEDEYDSEGSDDYAY